MDCSRGPKDVAGWAEIGIDGRVEEGLEQGWEGKADGKRRIKQSWSRTRRAVEALLSASMNGRAWVKSSHGRMCTGA